MDDHDRDLQFRAHKKDEIEAPIHYSICSKKPIDNAIQKEKFRLSLAYHFKKLTGISRENVFAEADAKYRPINLPDDNATMFAGYVGRDYMPGKGLLLLAINPGGGGDAYTQRIPEDDVFYPLLTAFKTADESRVLAAFDAINDAFVPIVNGWNLRRILQPTLKAAGVKLEQVAYMNVVPYRTREDKMPPVAARRTAWKAIVQPTLAILEPRAIITLGKKAGNVVEDLSDSDCPTYCVPRTIGDSYVSDDALEMHGKIRKAFGVS